MFDSFKRKKRITTIINSVMPLFYPHIEIANKVISVKPHMENDTDLNIFIYAASTFFINNVFKISNPSETGLILIGVFDEFYPGRGLSIFTQQISDEYKNDDFRSKLKVHYQDFVDYLHDGVVDKNITHDKLSNIRIKGHLTRIYDEETIKEKDTLLVLKKNKREENIEFARSKISDTKFINFLIAANETGEVFSILKNLDNGKSLDDIFYTGDEYGYELGVGKENDCTYIISLGYEYGFLAGGGNSWKVVYDSNDKVISFVKGMTWDS